MNGFFLDREGTEQIHQATLAVLQRTGLRVDHDGVARLLLEGGARRDDEGRILLPPQMVERALEAAERAFTVHGRGPDGAMELRSGNSYFGPGSDALHQADLKAGGVRDARLSDVTDNARLADALGFDFVMSMALPRELSPERLYPTVFTEMMRNSPRPLVTTAVTLDDVRHIHRLASLEAGGDEALRQRPRFLVYLEPISPLHLDQAGMERLLYCAEHGIPFIFAGGANCAMGAPVTPEGAVVQGSAECLAGLVVATLAASKVRFVHGSNTSAADMRSGMICYGAPEWARTVAMYADMARRYDLPGWGTAGCSDSQGPDAQAAWEAARSILAALKCQSTLVHDMGYLCFGELYDQRMLVLVSEVLREARHMLQPADLSEQALSLDVIDQVARGGSLFLGHRDTAKNFRSRLWMSKLINRARVGQGEPVEISRRLADRAASLLESHRPQPLDQELDRALGEYLEAI